MSACEGRVALVTGGSGGIGQAICRRLAGAGSRVAIGYGRSAPAAEQLRDGLRAAGVEAIAVGGELTDPEVPGRMLAEVRSRLGPVEVLVLNAGLGERRDLAGVDLALWDTTIAVNLRAPFLFAQAAVPSMREAGFGRILFVSSIAAFTGGIVGPHYAASKAGLHGLTHFIASREAGNGITVNAIAPALIEETGMLPGDPAGLVKQIPVGRLGRPTEVAELAMAMIDNGYLTNQVIGHDGGLHPR